MARLPAKNRKARRRGLRREPPRLCDVCLERPGRHDWETEDGTVIHLCGCDHRSAKEDGLYWVNAPVLRHLLGESE
jgi:hypothetical protein